MRSLSATMQARLDAPTSTFCHCWKILRRDGAIMGFTDHDQDLVFDRVTYQAASGLLSGPRDEHLGFGVGKAEVSGALTQLDVDEALLAKGLLDGASVETWLVDWSDVSVRLLLEIENIGEVRRGEHAFSADLRSLAHVMDQETGRRYGRDCSADLGDQRCGLGLSGSPFQSTAVVRAMADGVQMTFAISGVSDGWFAGGRFRIVSGVAKDVRGTIRAHRQTGETCLITLWTPLAGSPAIGDRVELTAGCDKSFETCGTKFNNHVNFRGFPHIPGNDVLMATPSATSVMDGGSLFK